MPDNNRAQAATASAATSAASAGCARRPSTESSARRACSPWSICPASRSRTARRSRRRASTPGSSRGARPSRTCCRFCGTGFSTRNPTRCVFLTRFWIVCGVAYFCGRRRRARRMPVEGLWARSPPTRGPRSPPCLVETAHTCIPDTTHTHISRTATRRNNNCEVSLLASAPWPHGLPRTLQ